MVEKKAGAVLMGLDPERFVGTWKLVSMVKIQPDGTSVMPFGDHPLGYLVYGSDGFMSAILMKSGRRCIGVQPEELREAVRGGEFFLSLRYLKAMIRYVSAASSCVSYCGRYEVRGDRVVHHVEASMVPDWIGTDLVRVFKFEGNTLTLTTASPGEKVMDLVWERVAR